MSSTEPSSEASVQGHASYVSYLASILHRWPEYRWLHQFLLRHAVDAECTVTILDATEDAVHTSTFHDHNLGYEQALKSFSNNTKTRVVMASYDDMDTVNKDMLDSIGLTYDVNPWLFWGHFYISRREEGGASMTPKILPTRKASLELGNMPFRHASIEFIPHETGNGVVLVLLTLLHQRGSCKSSALETERPSIIHSSTATRRLGAQKALCERYKSILELWDAPKIQAAIDAPMEFVFPLARLIASEMSFRQYEQSSIEEFRSKAFHDHSGDYIQYSFEFEASIHEFALKLQRDGLEETVQSLKYFNLETVSMSNPVTNLTIMRMRDIQLEFQILLDLAVKQLAEFYLVESRSINHRSVLETQKSIDQSDSVGRLTTLAFLFIPFSFVTSFFGMNIEEFGTGATVKLKVFIYAALATSFLVVLLWEFSGFVAQAVRQLRRNFDGLRFRTRTLKRFFWISPVGTIWLFIYGLSHDPELFAPFLVQLGIWSVLGLGKDWEAPEIGTDRQTIPLSNFWQKRADAIAKTTGKMGWEQTNFWTRWREAKKKQESEPAAAAVVRSEAVVAEEQQPSQ